MEANRVVLRQAVCLHQTDEAIHLVIGHFVSPDDRRSGSVFFIESGTHLEMDVGF